mmetsp:Transcript_23462/g.37696  ORF Transcript_23462/g.37696 Transcript_23462/m.37696 type:complete len:303 (-) Transcript_23462:49-957(-)
MGDHHIASHGHTTNPRGTQNGQSTTSTDKVTTTRRTSEDGKWRADDNNDDVKRSNERGNENDDRRSPVSVHAFVERVHDNTRLINLALDKRTSLSTRLAMLGGRVKLMLEKALNEHAELILKTPRKGSNGRYSSSSSRHAQAIDRREMEKLKSKARLLEEENHFLHSMLSDKEHQTSSAQHENTVLSRLVKEGERRVGQVREEASLLSDTLKASLQSLSGEMKKQVARLREEREMLTSSLRTALDRAALENTALRSQLAACGVSVDSILQGVVEKMMEEEKQREEAKQKELLRQQGAATPNE